MPVLWIPPSLRDLTGGEEQVAVPGATVAAALDALDQRYPGVRERLLAGDQLRPGIAVAVDGVVNHRRLRHPLAETSEVQFLPAVGGG